MTPVRDRMEGSVHTSTDSPYSGPREKLIVNQDKLMMKHCKYCVSKLKMALLFPYKSHLVSTIYKALYFMPHLL